MFVGLQHWDPLLRATACCNLASSLVGCTVAVAAKAQGSSGVSEGGRAEQREQAMALLHEALRVYPSHVPSLASAATLYSARGVFSDGRCLEHDGT